MRGDVRIAGRRFDGPLSYRLTVDMTKFTGEPPCVDGEVSFITTKRRVDGLLSLAKAGKPVSLSFGDERHRYRVRAHISVSYSDDLRVRVEFVPTGEAKRLRSAA